MRRYAVISRTVGTLLSSSAAPVTIRDDQSDPWSTYSRAASWLRQSPCVCLGLLLQLEQIGPSYKTAPRSVCICDQHRPVWLQDVQRSTDQTSLVLQNIHRSPPSRHPAEAILRSAIQRNPRSPIGGCPAILRGA